LLLIFLGKIRTKFIIKLKNYFLISILLLSKYCLAENKIELSDVLSSGNSCWETWIFSLQKYNEYIYNIEHNIKYKNLEKSIKYSSLFFPKKGYIACTENYENIHLRINGKSYYISSAKGTKRDANKVKIYNNPHHEYPVKNIPVTVLIKKIKSLKKVQIRPLPIDEPNWHPYITHDLLEITIKYGGEKKIVYGVAATPYDWMGDLPDWLEKELKSQREIEIKERSSLEEINTPASIDQ
jgi:hypothetical protein